MRAAKAFVVFEVFGTPQGFDVQTSTGESLGAEVPWTEGLTVTVTPPTLDPRSPRGFDAPEIITRIFHADEAGRTLLQEAEGSDPLTASIPRPGVVRAEVWIRPRHLRPYLGQLAEDYVDVPVPWIQTGGVFVR